MKNIFVVLTVFQITCFSSAFSAITFNGFQIHEIDSVTTQFIMKDLGEIHLKKSNLKIVNMGNYLDVTEEAWITGEVARADYKDNAKKYFFKGTITLPAKSVITGVQTWKYGVMYRGKLKQVEHNFDASTLDSSLLDEFVAGRVILLHKINVNSYELVLSNIDLGENRRVSIRYMLPNRGNGISEYNVPVLFHVKGPGTPENLILSYENKVPSAPLRIFRDSELINLDDETEVVLSYRSSVFFSVPAQCKGGLANIISIIW